jgi:hypothetical protein
MPAQQVHQPRLVAALGGVDGCGVVIQALTRSASLRLIARRFSSSGGPGV